MVPRPAKKNRQAIDWHLVTVESGAENAMMIFVAKSSDLNIEKGTIDVLVGAWATQMKKLRIKTENLHLLKDENDIIETTR